MAYTPPDRHALVFELGGGYAPPDRHALTFELPPPTEPEPEPYIPPLMVTTRMRWSPAAALERRLQARFRDASVLERQPRAGWRDADLVERVLQLRWGNADIIELQQRLRLSAADVVELQQRLKWHNVTPRGPDVRARWGHAVTRGPARRMVWRNRGTSGPQSRLPWKEARKLDVNVHLATGRALVRERQTRLPWGMAQPPRFQYLLDVPPLPPVPPRPSCYTPDRHDLEFRLGVPGVVYMPPDRHALDFRLVCGDGRYFNVRRTLQMTHSLSVVRLPDNLPLSVRSVRLTSDRDSWGWSVQMAMADVASLIAIEPDETTKHSVEITLDGHVFTAQIDGFGEDRAFGQRGGSVSGKSRTALLAAPDAPQRQYTNPAPATAQQLVLRELEFTDFALDWQITDWTVPARAWSYERETPISAISRIANAAGAMLQSAAGSDTLVIAPRMPAPPWAFAGETPDFTLAGGSWFRKGKRWNGGGRYNGVYVSGREQGILAHVYRDGTPGSPYAPDIVDPLITDAAPASGRGLQVIADSLPRHEIPIELPLMPSPAAPGLLLPGELGLIEDVVWGTYRAIVDSVEVSAEVDQDGAVTARQNATIWRYLP